VLLWTSTLDNYWTDLPLDPVYVPLVRQLATHAARVVPAAPAYTVGQTIDPTSVVDSAATAWVVESPSGRRQHLSSALRSESGQAALATLGEPGVYRLRPDGSRPDAGVLLAANVDAAEADPTRIEPAEIARAVADTGAAPNASAAPQESRTERESRQSLWRYLLVTLLALLAVESVVASRRPRLAR